MQWIVLGLICAIGLGGVTASAAAMSRPSWLPKGIDDTRLEVQIARQEAEGNVTYHSAFLRPAVVIEPGVELLQDGAVVVLRVHAGARQVVLNGRRMVPGDRVFLHGRQRLTIDATSYIITIHQHLSTGSKIIY